MSSRRHQRTCGWRCSQLMAIWFELMEMSGKIMGQINGIKLNLITEITLKFKRKQVEIE